MSAATAPSLAERQAPGLSETLIGPRDPRRCQRCAAEHTKANPLARWLEHDEWDRVPDHPVVVVLCQRCSSKVIEPHARLYRCLDSGEPFPGCMRICLDCKHRDGTSCRNPEAKINGGPGVQYEHSVKPIFAHICFGRGRGESRYFWTGRVLGCSGKEAL